MHRHPVLKDVTVVSPRGDRASAGLKESHFGHGVANLSRVYGIRTHEAAIEGNRAVALSACKVGFSVSCSVHLRPAS
jgi:hypothetical protein